MSFDIEPTGYEKTAISDLQGAWINLREAVVENFGFLNSDKLLFHIDEGMSWESVRNLEKMKSTLLLIHNITMQSETPEEVIEWIEDVRLNLEEAFKAIIEGKAE
ncbi:NAD-glutamate dehydrogenase [Spartinivicinus ruber]|uniref:NAD-glutamate dehydrogenase n=1 Tax=Spartinivicinus ruber TaxID=2683272 RepID=UPI0013D7B4E6|nr:NAD-glutamate dehydrogenase [Spartinivicinus ruber]